MELNNEIEFPPIEASLRSSHHIVSGQSKVITNAGDASSKSPRSSINFNVNAEPFTPKMMQKDVSTGALEENSFGFGQGAEKNQLQEGTPVKMRRRRGNTKPNSTGGRLAVGGKSGLGKRRLSVTSIANTSLTSIDTNITDSLEPEDDPSVLTRREKNISYGKGTGAYERYLQAVPRERRDKHSPRTPIKEMRYSRRQWDGLIKHWKLRLHDWDRDSNGVMVRPNASTPKRPRIKCDRRSMNAGPPGTPTSHPKIGDASPQSVQMMFSQFENKNQEEIANQAEAKEECSNQAEKKEHLNQDQEKEESSNLGETSKLSFLDWSQIAGRDRVMDWSKECESSEDEEVDEIQNKENMQKKDEDQHRSQTLQEKGIGQNDKLQTMDDEDGTVYKCLSLVDAITQFDDANYKEDEDADYVPPEGAMDDEEEVLIFRKDSIQDDSEDSSDPNLFYQMVQRNKPFYGL